MKRPQPTPHRRTSDEPPAIASHDAEPGAPAPRCLATCFPLDREGMTKAAQRDLAGAQVAFPARIDLVRADVVTRQQGMRHMSISGVQDKISLRLERGHLRAVDRDGTHLLKPIPSAALHLVEDVPANEHITMLAARALGIRTAAQGLIRLADGELAYVTRRFDRLSDGTRLHQEDLGVLLGASPETRGPNWKYEASYEEMGRAIAAHSAASQWDLQEFYRRVVFCFLTGNGDAHVRNFALLRDATHTVSLAPAYDLLNTQLHLPTESDMALSLRDRERDGHFSAAYDRFGFHTAPDFLDLAEAIGVRPSAAHEITEHLCSDQALHQIVKLVERSFLSVSSQRQYLAIVEERRAKLRAR